MLQAKTYLFCAIRPEVAFHRYTIATLNFAANASVVKLAPKKSVVAGGGSSAKEEKLLRVHVVPTLVWCGVVWCGVVWCGVAVASLWRRGAE